MLPKVDHPTDRPNFTRVETGPATYYFSYETCVAFITDYTGLVCCENVWSQTTGKHLNWIESDKTRRIPRDEFLGRLEAVTGEKVDA